MPKHKQVTSPENQSLVSAIFKNISSSIFTGVLLTNIVSLASCGIPTEGTRISKSTFSNFTVQSAIRPTEQVKKGFPTDNLSRSNITFGGSDPTIQRPTSVKRVESEIELYGKEAKGYENRTFSFANHTKCSKAEKDFYNYYQLKKSDHNYISTAKVFDEECLSRLSKENFPKVLKKNTAAILNPKEGVPFCMAVRIRDNLFLTARHCFYPYPPGEKKLTIGEAVISLLSDPKMTFDLSEHKTQVPSFVEGNDKGYRIHEDLLLLEALECPDVLCGERNNRVELSSPKNFARLIIPGPFQTKEESSWENTLRITKVEAPSDSLCQIYDLAVKDKIPKGSGCLSHACQTIGGYSGSPVFMEKADSSGWSLIAIHISPGLPKSLKDCNKEGGFESMVKKGVLGTASNLGALIPDLFYK